MPAARKEIAQGVTQRDALRAKQRLRRARHGEPGDHGLVPVDVQAADAQLVSGNAGAGYEGAAKQLVALCDREPDNYRRGHQADCKTFSHVEPWGSYTSWARVRPATLSQF